MRVRILLAIIITCLHVTVIAQTPPNVDSLLAELPKAKEDTNKVNLLGAISNAYFQPNPELSREYGQKVIELATKLDFGMGRLKGNNLVGRTYAVQNNLPMALKYFQSALIIAREIKSVRLEGTMLSSLSAVYTSNKDYDKALQYALEAQKVYENGGIKYMVNLMINIGFLYISQEKFEDALKYYQEGLRQEKAYGNNSTIGELANLYLNIGGVYIRMADYVPALENYSNAAAILKKIGHTTHYIYAIADIGETYVRIASGMSKHPLPDSLRNKNVCLDKAERFLNEARIGGEQLELMDVRSEVYESLSSLYALQGQFEKAYTFQDKHMILKDSLRNIDKEKEFARMEAQLLVKKQTDSLNYLNVLKDKEIAQKKLERNGGILLISLIGIIGLLIINRQKIRHQQKSREAEAETQRITDLAKQQLDDFTKSIQEKNTLIEKFGAEIERYQSLIWYNDDVPEEENTLQLLQNSVILTEEQWVNFQALFEKVHTGYISRVKTKFTDLTAAELRFVLLAKLGLANKEMAAMMGVSMEAIRVNKHRLLKKIHLPDGTSLEEMIHAI